MQRSGSHILDASALICLVRKERGWENVAKHGMSGSISTVNLCEVAYRLKEHGVPRDLIPGIVDDATGEVVALDREVAMIAASVYEQTRQFKGVSLADCVCLALGIHRQLPVVTADTEWSKIPLGIEIIQIRERRD